VLRGRAAAAADDVHPAFLGELAEQPARRLRPLVVAAERVREARVRVAARVRVGKAGELLDVGPHLLGAEGAVEADDERLRVLDGDPEGLQRLPRERAAGEVDDGDRDPER
jgi:hypothetical protein